MIFRALSPALPERLPAGTKAMMCHAGFGGVDPPTGEYYCFLETFGGGYGGRAGSDGPDAVQTHGQNTENAPVEETELNYPVRVTRLSLVEDSDGAGRFRGGLGLRKDFLFDRPTTFTVLADRDAARAVGRLRRPGRQAGRVRPDPRRRRDAAAREDDARGAAGRHDQLPHLRRRRLWPARGARPGARRRATSARARSAPRGPARSTAWRSTRASSTSRRLRGSGHDAASTRSRSR